MEKTVLQQSCIDFKSNPNTLGTLWNDVTSYSRDTKEKIPTSFETNIGGCRICITCNHINYRPDWIFHCRELGYDTKLMPSNLSANEAAKFAIDTCKSKILRMYDDFLKLGAGDELNLKN